MKLLIALCFFFTSTFIFSQEKSTKYYNSFDSVVTKDSATKYAVEYFDSSKQRIYKEFYDIDDNMLDSKDFNVKKFVKANEEWLDFVYENRKGLTTHKYDIVIGAVANDTLYQTLSLYESGILTKLETISRLKTHLLFDQISFHNADTLSRLKLIDYYKIDVK